MAEDLHSDIAKALQLADVAVGKYDIGTLSYEPSPNAQQRIVLALFGIDIGPIGDFSSQYYCNRAVRRLEEESELYRELRERQEEPQLERLLGHTEVEGELFVWEENGYRTMMNLKQLINPRCPLINVELLSPSVRAPCYQRLERIGNLHNPTASIKVSFYTVDEEGSRWSIHIPKIKESKQ